MEDSLAALWVIEGSNATSNCHLMPAPGDPSSSTIGNWMHWCPGIHVGKISIHQKRKWIFKSAVTICCWGTGENAQLLRKISEQTLKPFVTCSSYLDFGENTLMALSCWGKKGALKIRCMDLCRGILIQEPVCSCKGSHPKDLSIWSGWNTDMPWALIFNPKLCKVSL